jgi:hypothetical protein
MTVRLESRVFSMPALGDEDPLPMVGAPLENPYQIGGAIPQEIIDGSHYGNPVNLYPYQEQNGYGRSRSERPLRTVVLENERLRAVFLPELGGRLWELFDKVRGKHLLHSPPTIQFANLALRNAWFAGGIEWNIGTRGHSPTTCSPLHAALVRAPEGFDVLRMWEFDRLREVVFQIDAWLPDQSAVLFAAIRIRNPNEFSVPMYWWTNAAVPQAARSRVVVPADSAFASNESGISRVVPTEDGGTDCTWPTNNSHARDFFFDIPPEQRRWIVNADGDGDGLAMVSTPQLRGRKLFVWGEGRGGSRWQDWLSPDGGRYAEIQAGLAQTQFQHLHMPASAEWSWVEAYGNAGLDTDIAHGTDWDAAVRHSEERVGALIDGPALESAHSAARSFADLPPDRAIAAGTGWGALEAVRRRRNLPWIDETGTPFPRDTIGADQQPWLDLLEGSGFAGAATFVRGDDWDALLTDAQGPHALLHRAVLKHASGALGEARELYSNSLESSPSAIAYRGLAVLSLTEGNGEDGLHNYRLACAVEPDNVFLLIEAATVAIREGAAGSALALIEGAEGGTARQGRIRLLKAQALALSGDTVGAADILRSGVEVADLREGENALAVLWRQVFAGEAVPDEYQFSMNDEE